MQRDRHALIIGGSRGLGLGLVRTHLERGWRVTATWRTQSVELEELRRDAGDRLHVETLDITDEAQLESLAARLTGQKYDLLFLNAGIMAGRALPIGAVADEEIIRVFMTNAVCPIRVADRLASVIVRGSTVAFMTSILGSVTNNRDGRMELYRASKAALNSLTRSFAVRHLPNGFTVLSVHPGVVRTAMGGPQAPLDIETSVRGVADTLEARRGSGLHVFVDYQNQEIPW
jgi:NAD(P)-dependent dehydrogenase (short-subunit alcohol dehydrogenase family)